MLNFINYANSANKKVIRAVISLVIITFSLQAKTPAWVSSPPMERGYYSGVGSAPVIPGSSDHIEKARQAALSAIASQIQINVQSDLMSSIMENNEEIRENFERNIRTSTQAQLEGYEQQAQHEENGTYYVWYRLSIAKYEAIQAEKRRKAAELSISFYREYEKAREEGRTAAALQNAIRALQSIDAYIPEGLEYPLNGSDIYLVNHYYQRIQAILDNIELQAVQKVLQTKTGQTLKNAVFAANASGQPMKNLSLKISSNGLGNELPPTVTTDFSGKAHVRGGIIHDSKKVQILKAEVDLSGDHEAGAFLFPALLSQMQIPSATVMLQVSGPVIYLSSEEQLNGNSISMHRVEPVVKNLLTDAGFNFTDDLSSADFIMEIKVNAQEGSQVHTLFSAFADLNLSVTSIMNGNEIYKTSLKRVKGIDLSFEKAQYKALDAVAEAIVKEKAEEITKALH